MTREVVEIEKVNYSAIQDLSVVFEKDGMEISIDRRDTCFVLIARERNNIFIETGCPIGVSNQIRVKCEKGHNNERMFLIGLRRMEKLLSFVNGTDERKITYRTDITIETTTGETVTIRKSDLEKLGFEVKS